MRYTIKVSIILCLIIVCSSGILNAQQEMRYAEPGKRSDSFDPVTSNTIYGKRAASLIFESLFVVGDSLTLEPRLVERVIEKGRNYIIISLRKNVVWHSLPGTDKKGHLTSRDVVFTFNLLRNPSTQIEDRGIISQINMIKSIELITDYSLRITFNQDVIAPEFYLMFPILPGHILREPILTKDMIFFTKNPVGTGPYQFENYVKRNDELNLVVNENYYQTIPNIKKIVISSFQDPYLLVEVFSISRGFINLIPSVSPDLLGKLEETGWATIYPLSTLSIEFIAYNIEKPHLDDARIRKAITLAMDRKSVLKFIFFEQGILISGPYSPYDPGNNPLIEPLPYDTTRARQLLTEAGFTQRDKDGFLIDSDGRRLSYKLLYPVAGGLVGYEQYYNVTNEFRRSLREMGIEINIESLPLDAFERAVESRDYDMVLYRKEYDIFTEISEIFHSKNADKGGININNYRSKEADALIDSILSAQTSAEQLKYRMKFHEYIAKECPYAFLWSLKQNAAFSTSVKGEKIHPLDFFRYISEWTIDK